MFRINFLIQRVVCPVVMDHGLVKSQRNVMLNQTFAVFGEVGRVEGSFFRFMARKPRSRTLGSNRSAEYLLREYRINSDQQLFRGNRRTPVCCTSHETSGLSPSTYPRETPWSCAMVVCSNLDNRATDRGA